MIHTSDNTETTRLPGRLLAGLLLLLLNACVSPPPPTKGSFDDHQAQLGALQNWRMQGKIGLRHETRGGSASLSWEQRGPNYDLHLHGPLGIGSVSIDGNEGQVRLRNNKGEYTATSAEALIQQLTGWQIPVSALRYWAKGMPAPNLPVAAQQVEGPQLNTLQQGGWSIEYLDYQRVEQLWLPGKIIMQRPGTRVTIIPKQWKLL